MDRRRFVETCAHGATCAGAAAWPVLHASPAFAADAKPKSYARALLVDDKGRAIKASQLQAHTNYLFHYPFEATPAFLLNLGKPALPTALATQAQDSYVWPGGVGPGRSVVAFSAICAHQLVYPTPQVSFISFRKTKAAKGLADQLIHCCADHSQYDPSLGARVLAGPAPQPLCAVLLEHNAKDDSFTAYATLGGELFDAFFKKYEAKLSLDVGPRARERVHTRAAVQELSAFCKHNVQC